MIVFPQIIEVIEMKKIFVLAMSIIIPTLLAGCVSPPKSQDREWKLPHQTVILKHEAWENGTEGIGRTTGVIVLNAEGKIEKMDVGTHYMPSTRQMVITALPGAAAAVLGPIGSAAVYGNAIKSGAKAAAGATVRAAELGLEAMQYVADREQETTRYAVDNQKPSVIDNSVTNLTLEAHGGVALQQQTALGGQGGQGGVGIGGSSTAFAGSETGVVIDVNTAPPCEGTCGF